jgi:citrate synthase
MDILKHKFQEKSAALRAEIKDILKEHGDKVVDKITLNQVYGGARSAKTMIWETSELDAQEGIRFRGYSIPELKKRLPKGAGQEPLPEGLFWLMLVGEIPTEDEVKWLTSQWVQRCNIPQYVFDILDALPTTTHPMTQFILGITALQNGSVFAHRYADGMSKDEYWDAAYEDSMNLIARLPRLAAYIYRRTYHAGKHIAPNIHLDWGANFAHLLGIPGDDFTNLMRLYLTIHADHEGGNASAHATHLVGSTLSDPYLSFAGGMAALAGPLHGLANQEVIRWIFNMLDALGTQTPTNDEIEEYVHSTLSAGKVVPGYGHAVLRQPDPRFMAQMEFAKKYIKDDPIVNVVWKIYDLVPPILEATGKVKNPWPNVDAHSGALLVHYGMREYDFYTVLFGVSRALGVLASLCWSRALGFPLERPKSLTTQWVKNFLGQTTKVAAN